MASTADPLWAQLQEVYALLKVPLTLLLMVGAPTLLPRIIQVLGRLVRGQPTTPSTARRPPAQPVPAWLIAITAAHSAYHAYRALLTPPFNVFATFGIPLDVPPHVLRAALSTPLARAATARLYPSADGTQLLISRLVGSSTGLASPQTLPARLLYARFGHAVFAASWPRAIEEYALVWVARDGWGYVGAAALGMVCASARGGTGRKVVGWGMVGLVAAEGWVRVGLHLAPVDGDVLQLDYRLTQLRSLLLATLPPLLLLIPYRPYPNPAPMVANAPGQAPPDLSGVPGPALAGALAQALGNARAAMAYTLMAQRERAGGQGQAARGDGQG